MPAGANFWRPLKQRIRTNVVTRHRPVVLCAKATAIGQGSRAGAFARQRQPDKELPAGAMPHTIASVAERTGGARVRHLTQLPRVPKSPQERGVRPRPLVSRRRVN